MYMMMQIANFWTFLEANVNNIIHSAQLMQLLLHGCVGLGGGGDYRLRDGQISCSRGPYDMSDMTAIYPVWRNENGRAVKWAVVLENL